MGVVNFFHYWLYIKIYLNCGLDINVVTAIHICMAVVKFSYPDRFVIDTSGD